jgi:uncharacterized membrane protein YfhO
MTKNTKPVQLSDKSNHDPVILKSFDKFLDQYGHYFLFSLIALIIIFVFRDFILLKKMYLFKDIGSDSININYPGYYGLADYIAKEGFPKWSFNQGMGQNIFPSFDPFSLYIILMGKNLVYYTIFYAELFKIFCAGLFFYLFLKKIVVSDYTAIIGGVLYSFSGFIILGGAWNIFSTQAVYVALLLYSFEKLYQDDNWILFPVSIFLIASCQPLDLYFIGFFLVIYIVFRLFEANEKDPRKIFSLLTKIVFLGVIGVAMSSFFLINRLQIMLESPRGNGLASYFNLLSSRPVFGFEVYYGKTHYLTALMRFFSCDILGTGSNFKGWNNYLEAPLFYCGLIPLILLPHFLSLSDRRKIIIYFIFIFAFIFPVIFPFFRYSYWLFTGNYYRIFSFFVAVVILLIGLKSIENIDGRSKADIRITGATLLLLLLALYYPYKNAQIIDKDIRNTVAVFLIIYSILVYLMRFKNIKNIIKLLLLSAIIVELIYFSDITINKRPVISGDETVQKNGYNDYTIDAVKFIKSNDKTFFRINKDYCSSTGKIKGLNDAMVQDFYGTPSYHPFNQINYVNFLHELGIINIKDERYTRWILGLDQYPLLHSFASIKYSLTKAQKPFLPDFSYKPITKFGNVTVYKNKFALPLGFTYEKYISLKDFETLPKNRKMNTLYKAVVIDDRTYNNFGNLMKLPLSEIPLNYSDKEYSNDINILSRDTLQISEQGQNKIRGKINTDKNKMLFFSIPFDKGWKIKIDGKEVSAMMVNIGFIGVPVDKGLHDVELSYTPLYFNLGAAISLMAIILFICVIAYQYRRNKKIR